MEQTADPADVDAIPDHVPPELVGSFTLRDTMGPDAHRAVAALHQGPPIFYTPKFHIPRQPGGAWVPIKAKDIRAVLLDAETFGSKGTSKFSEVLGEDWDLIPLETDPPAHSKYRKLVAPIFGPSRINKLEEKVRARAIRMIEKFAGQDSVEFTEVFTKPFPAGIFLDMFGLPEENAPTFVKWANTIITSSDREALVSTLRLVVQFLKDRIEERRREPVDDLISLAVTAQVDGESLNPNEVLGLCTLLFNAGLDTVGSSLGLHFKHLAEHPEDQQLLRDNPELIPNAVDEMFRAYGVVNSTRIARRDVEIAGAQIRKGDRITCSAFLSGRDPDEYPNPDHVDFRRQGAGRHMGFGTGIHLCIGAPLARREIIIAIQEMLARIPPFRIAPGAKITTHGGGTVGVNSLPLVWR